VGQASAGTYPYFRTKFNNKCKELGVGSAPKTQDATVTYTAPAQPEAEEQEPPREKVKRSTKNYSDGDKMPEMPDLMPTGTIFDEYSCDRVTSQEVKDEYYNKMGEHMPDDMIEIGGFTRQCVDIVSGDAGAGKTYSTNILGVKAKRFAKREYDKDLTIHFISGEMRESEWAKELAQCELLQDIEVTYMLDYVGLPEYEEIFWDAFAYGDIVICDSLPAIISHFKMSWPASKGKMPTETQMIFQFIRKSLKSVEDNNNNVQLINQANKDGNFKGGTELPHMMSSMRFVRIKNRKRYITYYKNRNNGSTVKREMYFNRVDGGDIEFDKESYDATYNQILDRKEDVNDFMETLAQNQSGAGENEKSAAEMGTGGATAEEEMEIDENFIPRHLREDEPTGNHPTPGVSMFGDQTNLLDQVDEAERELAEQDLQDENM